MGLVLQDALGARLAQHMPHHTGQLPVQLVMFVHLVILKPFLAPQPATGNANNVKHVQPINTRLGV